MGVSHLLAFRTQVRVYRHGMTTDWAAGHTTHQIAKLTAADDWVPASCTLPTVEQPLRRREFDDLFAHDVTSVQSESPERIRLELRPDPEVAAVSGTALQGVVATGLTVTATSSKADVRALRSALEKATPDDGS